MIGTAERIPLPSARRPPSNTFACWFPSIKESDRAHKSNYPLGMREDAEPNPA